MKTWIAPALLALSTIALAAPAYAVQIDNIILSAEEDGAENQDVFTADTPMIYLSANLVEFPSSSTITVIWTSVDSHGAAPANYIIAQIDLTAVDVDILTSTLSKPDAGWPVGTYRVDMVYEGAVAGSANFEVK
ncbi:MAG: hypothetical protein ABIQ30_08355 [Devosia sp.]